MAQFGSHDSPNAAGDELFGGVDRREERAEAAELRKPGNIRHGARVMHWRERAALPKADAELFAYEAFGGQGFDLIENRLIHRLAALGASHFRTSAITRQYDCPPYPLGVYVEGWRVHPGDMEPPCREGDFWFPFGDDGAPLQSAP